MDNLVGGPCRGISTQYAAYCSICDARARIMSNPIERVLAEKIYVYSTPKSPIHRQLSSNNTKTTRTSLIRNGNKYSWDPFVRGLYNGS